MLVLVLDFPRTLTLDQVQVIEDASFMSYIPLVKSLFYLETIINQTLINKYKELGFRNNICK